MARANPYLGPTVLATLLALPATPLQATPTGALAPATATGLAGAGPMVPFWQPMGGVIPSPGVPDDPEPETSRLEALLERLRIDLGPEPEPEWAIPDSFLEAYPSGNCRTVVDEWALDKLAARLKGQEIPAPCSDAEAAAIAVSLGDTWRLEEHQKWAGAMVTDLDAYLCQVHKAWAASSAPDRDRVLFERLYATKGQRQALSLALRDTQKVIQACWKILAADPSRWGEPGDDVVRAQWPHGLPEPLRVDLLVPLAEDLERAKRRFDANVLPLLQDLKRRNAAPVRRDPEERIEAGSGSRRQA
jgi:hypothetical protein